VRKIALYFPIPAPTAGWSNDTVTTATDRVQGLFKVIQEITNKKKSYVCRQFGFRNCMIQTTCKNRTKITGATAFERNGSGINQFGKFE
jgi:hypothetical protein